MCSLQAADVAVAFIGGYHPEIGLMARLARDRGYPVQLMAGTNMGTEEFGLVAGPRPKERSSLTTLTRADAPKQRQSSSGSERRFRTRG